MTPHIQTINSSALASLQAIFGSRITSSAAAREQHCTGEAIHSPMMAPEVVAYPESQSEIVAALKVCFEHRVPVIPFGAGTSLEGHLSAPLGGLCLDLSALNAVREVRAEDLICRVEPGVTREQLDSFIRETGLFFPVDPGAQATLGGMAATGASGTTTIRYGTMKENVLGLEVALPDGEVIRTARQARKTSAGYDLTHLFIGSEGTLGIITELTLRLHPRPEQIGVCKLWFSELFDAVNTVIQTIQLGIPVARIELLDDRQIQACNRYSKLDLPEQPTLFLEFHGSESAVNEQFAMFSELAMEHHGKDIAFTTDESFSKVLWTARHNALPAAKALRAGAEVWVTDVCVPISRLAECILATKSDLEKSTLIGTIVGHVGEGNFHVFVIFDPTSSKEMSEVEAFSDRLVMRALNLEGTCTGEHGIGTGKKKYLPLELGPNAVLTMKAIKGAIDRRGIMNPSKIFD